MTAGRNAREVSHGMLLCMFLRQLISGTFFALLAACSSVPTVQQSGAAETDREAQTVPVETLNPDVRQDTIQQTICTPGYTASVRPATTYTNGVKTKLIRDRDFRVAPLPTTNLTIAFRSRLEDIPET